MALGNTGADGIPAANCGMILLVEGDDRISRLERFVLKRVGYRVTHAFSGEETLEILPNFTPSLILLDLMLPQMNGFATCQRIRECSQVPIIMVTAMDQNEDKVRGDYLRDLLVDFSGGSFSEDRYTRPTALISIKDFYNVSATDDAGNNQIISAQVWIGDASGVINTWNRQ